VLTREWSAQRNVLGVGITRLFIQSDDQSGSCRYHHGQPEDGYQLSGMIGYPEAEADLGSHGPENQTPAVLVKMRIKAALLQKGLKEPLKVDVVVLNNTAVLIGIVDDERERETVLETAKSTKPIRHAVDFLLLPEPGCEKLLLHRQMSGGNRPSETRVVLAGTRSIS
jgi:BON domain